MPRLVLAVALALLLLVLAAPLRAATLSTQLADINTGAQPGIGSNAEQFIAIDATRSVFVASDRVHGRELWITDGTTAGTRVLADICPGRCDSNPARLVRLDSSVYFVADDGQHGIEPWRVQTSLLAVSMVADLDPGAAGSSPSHFVQANLTGVTRVYFVARPFDVRRFSIFETGGSPGSTSLVLTTDFSNIRAMVSASNQVYMAATRADLGEELHRFSFANGSYGTALVEDIRPGSGSSQPRDFTQRGSRLFFSADDGIHGRELWCQDLVGTSTTMVEIFPEFPGSNPDDFTVLGGSMVFTAESGAAGRELWTSDCTPEGTQLVRDIVPGQGDSAPTELRNVDGQLLFLASTPAAGREPWRSDGTAEGTVLVKDQVPGSTGFQSSSGSAAVGTSYVVAVDGQLLVTDGSAASVRLVDGGFSRINDVFAGGAQAFVVATQAAVGEEPFRLVPGASTAPLLRNIGEEVGHSDPLGFAPLGQRTVFAAIDELLGREPRVSEGNADAASLLAEVRPDLGTSLLETDTFVRLGGQLLFVPSFAQLWATDGTSAGTWLVRAMDGAIECLQADADGAVFVRHASLANAELWRSDGTEAGTVPVMVDPEVDVRGSCSPGDLGAVLVGDQIYFAAFDDGGEFGLELYRVPRSGGNPVRVRDVLPGSASSFPQRLTALGGLLYFSAQGVDGRELWRSNGTAQGTVLVRDINPDGDSDPRRLVPFGDLLAFTANDGTSGHELYVTDGTSAGTRRVLDLLPGAGSAFSFLPQMVVTGGRLFFVATLSTALGAHLFVTDGTLQGTLRLTDEAGGLTPQDLVAVADGWVMFSAARAGEGRELWISNGSAEGTFLLDDIAPGPTSSSPRLIARSGERVFFSADDGVSGREPWTIPAPSDLIFADSFEARP